MSEATSKVRTVTRVERELAIALIKCEAALIDLFRNVDSTGMPSYDAKGVEAVTIIAPSGSLRYARAAAEAARDALYFSHTGWAKEVTP